MQLVHQHLLVRSEVDSPPKASEKNFMKDWLTALVSNLDMKIMAGPLIEYCHTPGNKGLTMTCIIETSHISAHIWDEIKPALLELDVYSCSKLDPEIVFAMLEPFDPVKVEWKFIDREHSLEIVDEGVLSNLKIQAA